MIVFAYYVQGAQNAAEIFSLGTLVALRAANGMTKKK